MMAYWRNINIQNISQQNAINRARQRYRHRVGPKSFAVIRHEMRSRKENKEDPNQVEVFVETRKRKNGKELDQETEDAINNMEHLIQDTGKSAAEAFQLTFGKEKPGRVRCFGRITTPTSLKRKQEAAAVKKQYEDHITCLKGEVDNMKQTVEGYEQKVDRLETILKFLVQKSNPEIDMETLQNLMGTQSSASTHIPDLEPNQQTGEENDRGLDLMSDVDDEDE